MNTKNSALKLTFWALFLSIPFGYRTILYQFTKGFHEYETVFLYARDFLLVAFLLTFILLFRKKMFSQKFTRIGFSIMAFLSFALLSIFFAEHQMLAVYSFVRLFLAISIAYTIGHLVGARVIQLRNIMQTLVGLAVVESIIGLFQFIQQRSIGLGFLGESALGQFPGISKVLAGGGALIRAYGTFSHPNILGAFLVIGLVCSYYFWIRRPSAPKMFNPVRDREDSSHTSSLRDKQRFSVSNGVNSLGTAVSDAVVGLPIFIISLGLLFSFSRSAWVAAAIASFVVIVYGLLKKGDYYRQSIRLMILVIAICIILFASFSEFILPRAELSLSDPSVQYRFSYNDIGEYLTKAHLFGVGIGNQVVYSVQNGVYEKFGMDQVWQWQPIHNIYLLISSEIGILGLAAFLLFIFFIVFSFKNPLRLQADLFSIYVIICVILFLGLFDHYFWTIEEGRLILWVVLGLVVGMSSRALADKLQASGA